MTRPKTAESPVSLGNPRLVEKLVSQIRQEGKITFARFMEAALYDPEDGYYITPGEKIGPQGDYFTSTDLHPVFGKLLARQIIEMDGLLDHPGEFVLLEMGAGKGLLCHDILTGLREFAPDFPVGQSNLYRRIRYLIVERSPLMVERQKELLGPFLKDSCRVEWHENLESKRLTGCILSNEFFDAFPVHPFVITERGLQEVYVVFKDGKFTEQLGTPSRSELADHIKRIGLELPSGFRGEINLEALRWMKEVGRSLKQGFVITMDYGYHAEELYGPHHQNGTLLCYHRHKVRENPYDLVGQQDITAHVDFTSLAKAGEDTGLQPMGFTDQTHFLMGLGIAQEMEILAARMENDAKAKKEFELMRELMRPDDMGKTFKILFQKKGLTAGMDETPAQELSGLRFRPFFKSALSGGGLEEGL
jgi:SAM-dependent MidA family methyltransferase